MRKVILSMFITLDGLISGPSGELGWMPGNEKPDKEIDLYIYNMLDEMDAILLGGTTYRVFVDFWPTATTNDDIIADKLNRMPKIVFSNTLDKVDWGKWDNARLAKETLGEEIKKLKEQSGKNMVMFGGANLAQSCLELDLIDEYRLFVTPIILGGGKRLFRDVENEARLKLLEAKKFSSGVVLLHYLPANR